MMCDFLLLFVSLFFLLSGESHAARTQGYSGVKLTNKHTDTQSSAQLSTTQHNSEPTNQPTNKLTN
jgi:hypothetical protein